MKVIHKQIIALMLALLTLASCISVYATGGYRTLYAEDGRSKDFPESQVDAQLTVGWYTEPVQRLYAEGKSKVFPKTQVDAQLTVGWYTEPVQRLYAPGKSKVFPKTQVAAQLNVGWYTEPVTKMYAADGRTKVVKTTEVAANKKVGWYISPVVTMYALGGRTIKIADVEIEAYKAVGWYTEPVIRVYSPDDETKIIKKSEFEAYKNAGWSNYRFFMLRCSNDDWSAGKKIISWPRLPGVAKHNITIVEQRNSRNGDIPANTPVTYYNIAENCIYLNTYPNCTYTITVWGGGSVGEYKLVTGVDRDYDKISKIWDNNPTSKAEADKLMVKITVPAWKLSNGKKVSSTVTLTVHKDIADVTKLVFQEIYNGKEKFPIKDIGAYSWRGGRTEHNSGTAIDINSNENYCIYPDGTTIGSYWKPGIDPYSIKPYGDVVRAFEKYGFTWGGDAWSSPRDFMHFSYMGT